MIRTNTSFEKSIDRASLVSCPSVLTSVIVWETTAVEIVFVGDVVFWGTFLHSSICETSYNFSTSLKISHNIVALLRISRRRMHKRSDDLVHHHSFLSLIIQYSLALIKQEIDWGKKSGLHLWFFEQMTTVDDWELKINFVASAIDWSAWSSCQLFNKWNISTDCTL